MLQLEKLNHFFISCPRECEPLLLKEAQDNNLKGATIAKGGINLDAKIEDAFAFLLQTRVASRVYLQLFDFKFKNEKEVATKVYPYSWSELFSVHQSFKITPLFDFEARKTFSNSLYFAQLAKDGIVDHFRNTLKKRPSIDTRNPDIHFLLRIEKSKKPGFWEGKMSLDLTGFALSNRGYRIPGHPAPLRENLAAAIVSSIDFKPNNEKIFIDSMSGTGTLIIEAILLHYNISPSYLWLKKKNLNLTLFNLRPVKSDEALRQKLISIMNKVVQENESNLTKLDAGIYFAYDNSVRSLDILKKSLQKAGLDWKKILVQKKDALTLTPPAGSQGVILCNPPYGKRLGEIEELEPLYYEYGENLKKNFKGFEAYIFTSNPELRKKISLQTSKRIPFYNGDIECRLLRYNLF